MNSARAKVLGSVLLLLTLVAGACTSADTDDDPSGNDSGDGAPGMVVAEGVVVEADPEMLEAVSEWLVGESGLSDMFLEELFLVAVDGTGDVTHLTYDQQHGGVSVRGAQLIIHVGGVDEVLGATNSLTDTLPGEETTEELTADEAVEIAGRAVEGTVVGEPEVVATWLEDGGELRLGWEVRLTTEGPMDALVVIVDATDGDVLSAASVLSKSHAAPAQAPACDLPEAPAACVFPVHPLADGSVADDTDDELVPVSLPDLTDPESGDLIGRYVQIHPDFARDYHQADGLWAENGARSLDDSLEAANAYLWITLTARTLDRLGFDYHADDPVDLIPLLEDDEVLDNAFFSPVDDILVFGEGSGGNNLAEDGGVVIHEYGHAILDSQLPFITSLEGAGLHEGFADAVALFMTNEFLDDPACLGAWGATNFGFDCFRRLDVDRRYPDSLTGEPHDDGEIYGSAVYAVFAAALAEEDLDISQCASSSSPCAEVSDAVFETMLASLGFMTSDPGLEETAAALVAADEFVYDGRYADIIESVLEDRGLSGGRIGGDPGDGRTRTPGAAELVLRVHHSYRGDLDGRITVLDADGESLCTFTLFTPDPEDDSEDLVTKIPLGDDRCAEHLPPSADRRWRLQIADTLADDVGQVTEFAIRAAGTIYRSRGLPQSIPDEDRLGVVVTIGDDGGSPPPAPTEGAFAATVEIEHSYHGDLSVVVGLYDAVADEAVCVADGLMGDLRNDASGPLTVTVDLGSCTDAFQPGNPDQSWLVFVTDGAALDTGEIVGVDIVTPDGTYSADDVPVAIPDDDPDGAVVEIPA